VGVVVVAVLTILPDPRTATTTTSKGNPRAAVALVALVTRSANTKTAAAA
jgi:hypothetical protein